VSFEMTSTSLRT